MKMLKLFFCYSILFLLAITTASMIIAYSQDDVAEAIYKEGLRKYILENYTDAIKDFESALKIDPGNEKIKKIYIASLIKIGNLELEKGNLVEANKYYTKAYSISKEPYLKENIIAIQRKLEEKKSSGVSDVVLAEGVRKKEKPVKATKATFPSDQQKNTGESGKPIYAASPVSIDIEKIFEQQAKENKRLISDLIEAQKLEQKRIIDSLQRNQDLLTRSLENQNMERQKLYQNLSRSWKQLDERIKQEKEERTQLIKSIERNQFLLEKTINSQISERNAYLTQIKDLLNSQREDRKLFVVSLIILAVGAILITFIVFIGFLSYYRKHLINPIQALQSISEKPLIDKPELLLEYRNTVDEVMGDTKYITDESYNDAVRIHKLSELYQKIKKGTVSWDLLEEYITELSSDMKSEILSLVENKLKSGEVREIDNAIDILLPLITDGEKDISTRTRTLIKKLKWNEDEAEGSDFKKLAESIDPLSFVSLMPIAKLSDSKTGRLNHSVRVAELAGKIAEEIKYSELESEIVKNIGLSHDIGYLELPESIFKKRDKLTEEEFEIIKTHPIRGVRLLVDVNPPDIFIEGIKYHHERMDGSGYPEGLKNNEIPLVARILSVADFFEAITSKRPYRPARGVEECLRLMESLGGTIFDEDILGILIKIIERERII